MLGTVYLFTSNNSSRFDPIDMITDGTILYDIFRISSRSIQRAPIGSFGTFNPKPYFQEEGHRERCHLQQVIQGQVF